MSAARPELSSGDTLAIVSENDQLLSQVQKDILELESMTWKLDGSKISEFRRRHPHVTETAYYVALHRLLSDPRAFEYRNQKYAPMLRRIAANQRAAMAQRPGARGAQAQT